MIGAAEGRPGVYAWDVELYREVSGRRWVFKLPDPFESPDEPTALDVLSWLTGACNVIDQVSDWAGWASFYTSDPDEQDRYYTPETYWRWTKINDKLRKFLGEGTHDEYLYNTERDD
jgi:hypothetical protein